MDENLIHYFAYGRNMDSKEMASRCPAASQIGVATLVGHAFRINSRGVATVVADDKHCVYGLLWRVTETDLESLDRFEGVKSGFYTRNTRTVELPSHEKRDAVIYIASDEECGAPRRGYLENILSSAQEHRFPAHYIDELRIWLETDV